MTSILLGMATMLPLTFAIAGYVRVSENHRGKR
jgi:hypothetical protein